MKWNDIERVGINNPINCLVGCTNYLSVCPVGAISFPDMKKMRRIIRELREESCLEAKKENGGENMDVIIRIFGPSPPCAKCQAAEKVAREVAQKLGEVTVVKYDIFSEEAEKYNIMMTPTVMVNNTTFEVGRVPSAEKLERAVRDALNSRGP